MAAKEKVLSSQEEGRVRIRLPFAEDAGDGLKADQNEQVILDGRVWNLRRGEYVEVPPRVFWALRERYPDL